MTIYENDIWPQECLTTIGTRALLDQSQCTSLNDKAGKTTAILDDKNKLQVYVVVLCANKYIGTPKLDKDGKYVEDHGGYTREQLAFLIVFMDSLIMLCFLVTIWVLDYLIQMDIQRQNNQLLECKSFSITISNLPQTSKDYRIH